MVTWMIPKVLVWIFWASVMANKEQTAEDKQRREPGLHTKGQKDCLEGTYISCKSNQSQPLRTSFLNCNKNTKTWNISHVLPEPLLN